MTKFISYIFAIVIGIAAFGLTGPARATLIACSAGNCDGQYNFDADDDIFDAMFTIELDTVTEWMYISGQFHDLAGFSLIPFYGAYSPPVVFLGGSVFSDFAVLAIEDDGGIVRVNPLEPPGEVP